jgi:hypothetical protein
VLVTELRNFHVMQALYHWAPSPDQPMFFIFYLFLRKNLVTYVTWCYLHFSMAWNCMQPRLALNSVPMP